MTERPLSTAYIGRMIGQRASTTGIGPGVFSARSLSIARQQEMIISDATESGRGALLSPHWFEQHVAKSMQLTERFFITPDTLSWRVRLSQLFDIISRIQNLVLDSQMKHLGASRSQFLLLAQIELHGGITQTELAQAVALSKVTLSAMLDRLASGGWIERRIDPVDARVRRIYLTQSAQNSMHELSHTVEEMTDTLFRSMPENEGYYLIRRLEYLRLRLLALRSKIDD